MVVKGTEFDIQEFTKRKVSLDYPCLVLPDLNQTTPLVISDLESGDMPIVGVLNGDRRILCKVSSSAYNIEKLLRTHNTVEYCKNEETKLRLTSIIDYLEVVEWTY